MLVNIPPVMFTHLHVHTEYSLLDGLSRIPQLVKATADMGMTSLAITDHGSLYGVVDFYSMALEAGVKPIIGCEIYQAYEQLKLQMEQQITEAMTRQTGGVGSGRINVEAVPEFQQQWLHISTQIDHQYEQHLGELREQLLGCY